MSGSKYFVRIDPTKQEDKYKAAICCNVCNKPVEMPLNISTADDLKQILNVMKSKINHLKCPNCELKRIDDHLS